MKKFINEFKEFISRGSVIDLAVGVIMGSAFTAIVNSLVNDIIMPAVGAIFGGVSFADLKIVISEATEETAEAAINYGNFIQQIVNFLIIALVIFLMVKLINGIRKKAEELKKKEEAPKEEPKPAEPSDEVKLLTEIRDLLNKNK